MTDVGRRLEQAVRSLFHGAAAAPRQEIGVSVTRNGRPAQALLLFSCAGVEQAGGKRALVCLQDVTAAKQVEAQLRQSQKLEAIGTLAGGIAHDFNNILTGVINFTALAREDCPPAHPQIREFLDEVLAGGRRAKDLVRQLMLFSRNDTGGQEPVRLQPIIRETLALLRSTLPSTASMETDIAPEAPAIHGNPSQLHQVVMNVVINAAQALEGRVGRITVRLAPQQLTAAEAAALPGLRPGPHLRLEVADTGCGMDEAVIARIYEPFFTTKEVGQGTGLGLSVVHSVVRSHGGAIAVSSSPGAGTTFGIYFPLPAAAPAGPEQGRAAIPEQ
ncbi:MAG: hypothetical protein HYX71_12790 [Opitutae bacterium]|nr:hypothetical protein [Opitutae bacterium]